MIKGRFFQILIILGISIGFFMLNEKEIFSYNCTSYGDYYCNTDGGVLYRSQSPTGELWTENSYKTWCDDPFGATYECYEDVCERLNQDWPYNCSGTDTNCNGGANFWSTQQKCEDKASFDVSAGCCDEIPCIDCNPSNPTCPSGTTSTNTGDFYSNEDSCCSTGSSPCEDICEGIDCYCNICTLPDCDDLNNNNQGWGDYPEYKSCRNTPVGDKCNTLYRTCYCYEPPEPPLCPSPLLESNPPSAPNMILDNFTYTHNKCNVYKYHDCYEPISPQPTESLVIINDDPNFYGFSSKTHSGIPDLNVNTGNLNDPIDMVARYSDPDGADTIEGIFVWFRDISFGTGSKPDTPVWISTTTTGSSQALSNDSWGFMMHKEGTTWVPYIPNYIPDPDVWKKVNPTLGVFYIKGPDGNNMVKVTINDIASDVLNSVVMDFSLGFTENIEVASMVEQTTYNIALMGLDVFSFTPFDNYTFPPSNNWPSTVEGYWPVNKLRYRTTPEVAQTYAKDWSYSNAPAWNGNTWTVDKKQPDITFINDTPSVSGNSIVVEWSATDNADGKGLYAVVGNIFLLTNDTKYPITVSSTTPGVQIINPSTFTPIDVTSGAGKLDSGWAFKMLMNGANSSTGKIYIDIGENRKDSIEFDLTVFDNAGNMNPDGVSKLFDLNDWFVTDGGLAYSKGGTSFVVKDVSGIISTWGTTLPPFATDGNESLIPSKADYSSEMWGEGDSTIFKTLIHSNVGSYTINNFKFAQVNGYYDTLIKAYEKNKGKIPPGDLESFVLVDTVITQRRLSAVGCGNKTYCVINANGNLTISTNNSNPDICNKKALIFVGGNLTINPPFRNSSTVDSCIFVVKGTVSIGEGEDADATDFAYDHIDAFILADDKITIGHELTKVDEEENPEIIDNADVVDNWYIENNSGTEVSHSDDKAPDPVPDGGSVKIVTDDELESTPLDLMEYSTDALASTAYVGSTFTATGGTKYTSGGYNYHKFTANGVFTVPVPISVEALVVGGGGGGCANYGNGGSSGGGAGGVISGIVPVNSTVSVVVGAGGAPSNKGKNSVFSTLIGNGGGYGSYSGIGGSGGSGGGGAEDGTLGYSGLGTQGHNGGIAYIYGNLSGGGGGGGAASKGKNGFSSTAGGAAGGAGTGDYSTWLLATSSGVNFNGVRYIAGGGGGGDFGICTDATSGLGGIGGGGQRGFSGRANTGGGGGGACEYPESTNFQGGAGGSGLVLVRYPNTAIQVYSEASIKQQGSYALKVFAPKDISLNQTIVKTFATPIYLSNYSGISFQLRSTRVGSNIKIGFKDSGGTITEITPNITVANEYKEYIIDLTSVPNVNKDAINQIIITILNATEDNTFYIDNVNALISESQGDKISLTKYNTPNVPRDMSQYTTLTFYVKSTIAGQKMRFQFGENTTSRQIMDITITTANVWEPIELPIGSFDRNSVRYFEFVITDALTPFTFWFDHIVNGGAPPPDPTDSEEIDGLYINGGLMSSSIESPSIEVNRYLRLIERLRYPVLAIDSHPKYGELARTFFGSNFRMQKTEVGFKPY